MIRLYLRSSDHPRDWLIKQNPGSRRLSRLPWIVSYCRYPGFEWERFLLRILGLVVIFRLFCLLGGWYRRLLEGRV